MLTSVDALADAVVGKLVVDVNIRVVRRSTPEIRQHARTQKAFGQNKEGRESVSYQASTWGKSDTK